MKRTATVLAATLIPAAVAVAAALFTAGHAPTDSAGQQPADFAIETLARPQSGA